MSKTRISIETLKRLVPLSSLSDHHLNEIWHYVGLRQVPKGKILFKRGAASNEQFYLLDGSVDLLDSAHRATPIRMGTFESHEPLNPQGQTHTAITLADSTILSVDKNKLDFILTWCQSTSVGIMDLAESTKVDAGEDEDWMSALLRSNLFTQIPPANIQNLFRKFQERTAKAGEVVVRQGEEGENFYVIQSGEARVTRQEPETGEQETRAELRAGDFFGEDALISDAERNATVTMTREGILMYLTKQDFKTLLHQPVLEYVAPSEIERLRDEGQAVKLIDVRLPQEYDSDPSEGSENIPLLDLRKDLDAFESADAASALDADTVYVVCADGGRRSEVATHLLRESGLTAYLMGNDS